MRVRTVLVQLHPCVIGGVKSARKASSRKKCELLDAMFPTDKMNENAVLDLPDILVRFRCNMQWVRRCKSSLLRAADIFGPFHFACSTLAALIGKDL